MAAAARVRTTRLAGAALALIVLVLVARVAGNQFTLDSATFMNDRRIVNCELGAIWSGQYWPGPLQTDGEWPGAGLWRPLTLTILALLRAATPEDELAAGRSTLLHLTGAVLHALLCVMLFLLGRALLGARAGAERAAWLAALLFGCHPVASELVGTAVGLGDLLAACGVVGGLLLLVHGPESLGRCCCAAVLAGLALLSKEIAVVALPAALLLLLLHGSLRGRALLLGLWPFALVTLLWLVARMGVVPLLTAVGDPPLQGFTTASRLATGLAALGSYDLPALVWPLYLLPDVTLYDLPPAGSLGDGRAITGLVLLVILAATTLFLLRCCRTAAFGLLFAGLAFLPVSNLLLPVGALCATRFLYLPLLGLTLALSPLLAMGLGSGRCVRRLVWWTTLAACVLLGWRMQVELAAWRSPADLAEFRVERSPTPPAWHALAVTESAAGREGAALRLLERTARAPRVEIPANRRLTERGMLLAWRSALEAGRLHVRRRALLEARAMAELAISAAQEAARRGAGGHGPVWRRREGSAHSLLGLIDTSRAQATTDRGQRDRLVTSAERALGRAEALRPRDLRVRLRKLVLDQVRGRHAWFEQMLPDLGELALRRIVLQERRRVDDSREVVEAWASHLERTGRAADARRVRQRLRKALAR